MSHKKLLLWSGTMTAVLATVGGYAWSNQAGADSKFGNHFTVVESGVRQVFQDEATQAPPDLSKPTPPGDTLVFKADLLEQNQTVGEARGACTSVFDTKYVCEAYFTITGRGTLALQVPFDVSQPEGDYVVTGGTGDFAGKHGWAHFTTASNGDETHTFYLRG